MLPRRQLSQQTRTPTAARRLLGLALLAVVPAFAADLVSIDPLGLRLARGFRIAPWADPDLANDIRALTFDARGRVVVSGPGYIRTLLDTDGNGMAETAVEFAPSASGAQGLCFDGPNLFCVGDGALQMYTDQNGDGVADGPSQNLLPLDTGGHGACSIRKGPDGWLYVITGNEVNFGPEHVSLGASPIRAIEGGAMLRLRPSGRGAECIAHGFRNPRDFDFNGLGDLFTVDGDAPADLCLPWYVPARLFQVGYAAHHGWRFRGLRKSWPRPGYSPDTVSYLAAVGQAVPSGAVCYRHFQFPVSFRNGLFFCDWSSGRVYFTPLVPEDSSYHAAPEVFLEPIGRSGFAPVDLAVAPDGALLVAAGGGRTRGAIYRIDFPPGRPEVATHDLLKLVALQILPVLDAPQPLDAWSRAAWMEVAQNLGPEPFAQVVCDNRHPPAARVRAIEILTELFDGLAPGVAGAGAQSPVPMVRARTAWSIGRALPPNAPQLLLSLAQDPAPAVRRCALEALADHVPQMDLSTLQQTLAANLGHPDRPVRRCAARLASLLPEPAWRALWAQQAKAPVPSRLTATLALLDRNPANALNTDALDAALSAITASQDRSQQLEAIRLAILALGDYRVENPTLEVYAPYQPALSLQGLQPLVTRIQHTLREMFPTPDPDVNREAARLLAFVQDDAPSTPVATLSLITAQSPPTDDFHYLAVLARLTGPLPSNAIPPLANAILSLDRKWQGRQNRDLLQWKDRFPEVVQPLLRREPSLAVALLKDPNFVSPSHVFLASLFGAADYQTAARQFLAEVKRNPKFGWTGPLVDMLGALPDSEVRPLLRRQWSKAGLRDDLLLVLASQPELIDREKFLAGLSSPQPRVVCASLAALAALPAAAAGKGLAPALLLLRRLWYEPAEQTTRAKVLSLIERETGQSFRVRDTAGHPEALRAAYQPVFDWCVQRYPQTGRAMDGDVRENPAMWNLKLKSVRWDSGDPGRGQAAFRAQGCQMCHTPGDSIGPPLTGVAARYPPAELLHAIMFPNREVAEPYRSTTFQMRNKQTLTGLVVSDTPENILLQTGATTTVRLHPEDIVSGQKTVQSIMPSGLVHDLGLQELADLHSYLRSL